MSPTRIVFASVLAVVTSACTSDDGRERCPTAPIMRLSHLVGGGVCALDGPLEGCAYGFPSTGTNSAIVANFKVENASCATLQVAGVGLTADSAPEFQLDPFEPDDDADHVEAPASLLPLERFVFGVRFGASESGAGYRGAVAIETDAANVDSPLVVELTGAGE